MRKYNVMLYYRSDKVIRTFLSSDNSVKSIILNLLTDDEVRMFIRDYWDDYEVCVIED